ncbi:MAG: NADH-quinone oxidoreductase subunit N [Actinomycetota bacterium]|nr:NADH-quinone oxidoreductase subunit N [Actinomycetota bacterium]
MQQALHAQAAVHSQAALHTQAAPCLQGNVVHSLCTAKGSLHIPVEYRSIAPVLVLGIGSLVLLGVSALIPRRSRPAMYPLMTAVIGGAAAVASALCWADISDGKPQLTIGGQVFYDHFSMFFCLLIGVATVFGALLSDSYLQREGLDGVEAYALMCLAGAGAMLMAESAGTIMLFLGLEIMSIALYVLTAFHRRRAESGEAGLKYFILGSFSSAIFLYGAALSYGATGTTQFTEMAQFLGSNVLVNSGVLLAGMALLIVGLGFKVAAVPFHFWTPDVYQGSPTPFTGYMAAVAKAAGFAGLLRILLEGFGSQQANWRPIIWVMAVLTLLVGSVLAIVQRDLKRMLAYSSISQAGYVLIGVQAGSSLGTAGALFYLLTYTFIIAGSFAVVSVIQGAGEERNDLGAVRGLSKRRPVLALTLLILLLAQAGIPFTSGFLAKFYVIEAAVQRGQYALAIIGMLAAAIAAFFYLRVGILMYSAPVTGSDAADGMITAGLAPMAGLDYPRPVDAANGHGAARSGEAGPSAAVATTATTRGAGTAEAGTGDTAGLVTLLDPPTGKVTIPFTVGITLVVCVAFTIFAGVSSPVIDFAKQATMFF